MKKFSLLKVLGFTFLGLIILSFIIPVGSYSSSSFVSGATSPIGLYDIFNISTYTVANFLQFGLLFLVIGGFYSVLNKTGAYSNLIERIVKKLKNKKIVFILTITIIFSLLTALSGLGYIMFFVMPFVLAILLSLGFSKITSFMATIASIIVGYIGNIIGSDITYSMMTFFKLSFNYEIFTKIILFILVTFILTLFVHKNAKKDLKDDIHEEIPLYEKNKSKKTYIPLIVIGIFTIILLFVSMYRCDKVLGINIFNDIYEKIMTFEINGYPLFKNILGSSLKAFGYFTIYDMTIILAISSIIIAFVYSISAKDFVKAYFEGFKKMLGVAVVAIMANVIVMSMYRSSSVQNIYFTLINYLADLTKNISIVGLSLVSGLGSIFYNDFASMVNVVSSPIMGSITDTLMYPFVGMVIQTIYNLFMLFVPTSIILMSGLAYYDISYKKWIKSSWKLLLSLFGIILAVLIILLIFI